MEHSATGYFVPIACRFVPHDQWLVTHLHTTWKIADVKLWLLAKYFPTLFTAAPSIPRRHRSQRQRVSPIRFARREEISDDEQPPAGDVYEDTDYFGPLSSLDDDDDPVLSDQYRFFPRNSPGASASDIVPKANSSSPHAEPSNYVLLSYSTTQILEDGWKFEWYTIHPHELLELHTYPYVVKLPRSSIFDYCLPYFEGSAWVLQLIDDSGTGSRVGDEVERLGESIDSEREKMKKRRRYATWHQRWIVIHEGYFHIYKDRQEPAVQYRAKMNSIVGVRGSDYLEEARKTTSDFFPGPKEELTRKRFICAKFRHEPLPADNSNWFRRGSRDASTSDETRNHSSTVDPGNADEEADESWTGDIIAFCLIMHDSTAYNHIRRILNRSTFPPPTRFFPDTGIRHRSPHRRRNSYSPLHFASVPSSEQSSTGSPEPLSPPRTPSPPTPTSSSVRYPEWRWNLVHKAKRAGLGDVGRAIELARFGDGEDPDDAASDYEDNMFEQQPRGRTLDEKWGVLLDDDSDGNNSDSESEREWEDWEVDHQSNRARRPFPFQSWTDSMHPQPFADYNFPATAGQSSRKSALSPRSSLRHYPSDSLMRQSLQRMTPIRYGPIQAVERAESPSPGFGRSRPRSPLAEGEFDNSEVLEILGMEPGLAVTTPQQFGPDVPYPHHRTSHEAGLRSNVGPVNPARMITVPLSMAMTTTTSKVSAGDPGPSKKGKGKQKGKVAADSPSKMSRNRSLTVQGTPTIERPSIVESSHDNMGLTEGTADKSASKPGKMKLPKLSFAQVAASGLTPSSSSSRNLAPPLSATTSSSFESPTFTHPDDSD